MAWSDADDLLTESRVYWIASVRPDGGPHIVPSDGIWLDDALYFGGSPDTVHMRNVRATGRAVAHVGDGLAAAVISKATSPTRRRRLTSPHASPWRTTPSTRTTG
jgi:nitroimidazol reductase NimA-like FMN-containing flavoprotein (pyridoxamine 5'-phosphate oxidase superfamily)